MTEPLLDSANPHAMGPAQFGVDINVLKRTIIAVCQHASRITSKESRILEINSPVYVLGDIHGNLTDLEFFRKTLWPAGPEVTAGDFLFLGDFVDRGRDSIPVIAYIMSMKILNPGKWHMIRGNHETREVNGNIEHYQEGSFLSQCLSTFGESDGYAVWEAVNNFFDTLALAATIDSKLPFAACLPPPTHCARHVYSVLCCVYSDRYDVCNDRYDTIHSVLMSFFFMNVYCWVAPTACTTMPLVQLLLYSLLGTTDCEVWWNADSIFCVHGGIPRELCKRGSSLDLIRNVPCPMRSVQTDETVYDMLWSDPTSPEQESSPDLDSNGFGISARGCTCFGERSIDLFLDIHGFKHVFRGHEAQQSGVGVSKSARLTTIFSTSKDHFAGDITATCGCVLVDHNTIHPIVRALPAAPHVGLNVGLNPTYAGQSVEAQEVHVTNALDDGHNTGGDYNNMAHDRNWTSYWKEDDARHDGISSMNRPRRAWEADSGVMSGIPRAGTLASRLGT